MGVQLNFGNAAPNPTYEWVSYHCGVHGPVQVSFDLPDLAKAAQVSLFPDKMQVDFQMGDYVKVGAHTFELVQAKDMSFVALRDRAARLAQALDDTIDRLGMSKLEDEEIVELFAALKDLKTNGPF